MPAHWCAWHPAKWTNEWMDEWSHKCPWASVTGGWSSQHPQLLPSCCLAGNSPELSAPHIPQGPEADASSEEGQCFFGLQEFFWAFVPLPMAVQFARQGSSHVTGCVLCSSIQPPQRHKGGINWLKWVRRFPAPAHLQSPEEGGNSKCQWDRKSRKGPPRPPGMKGHILGLHSHADFMLKPYAVFLSVTGGMAGCMSDDALGS